MKINYLNDGIGAEFVCSGIVTGREITEANEEIYGNDNLLRQRFQPIYRPRCAEYRVSSEEIRMIAAQNRAAARKNANVLVALVSSSDLQYGLSRMYRARAGERDSSLKYSGTV